MTRSRKSLAALFGVYLFVISFPKFPPPPTPGLDTGWRYGLNAARALRLSFGSEIVYTYGPLGYLLLPHDLATNLAEALVFGIVLAALLGMLGAAAVRSGSGVMAAVLFVIGVTATRPIWASEQRILYPVLLALALALVRTEGGAFVAVAIAWSAAVLLIKFNHGITCIGTLTGYFIMQAIRRRLRWRDVFVSAAAYVGCVELLFVLTGNQGGDLPAFLSRSVDMSLGYSDGMSIPGPVTHIGLAAGCLAVVALLGFTASTPVVRMIAALELFPLLMSYKQAFVRHDLHAVGFFTMFSASVGMLALFARGKRETAVIGVGVLLGVVLAIDVVPAGLPDPSAHPPHRRGSVLRRYTPYVTRGASPQFGVDHILAYAHWSDVRWRPATRPKRSLQRLVFPPTLRARLQTGTVDVVPIDPTYVAANDLRWNPRPVFQSFAVLTPALDALNAAHFRSATAPDFVLYRFESIDGRHPFFDEPATLREIFCRYALESSNAGTLVLDRRASRCDPLVPGERLTTHWGEEVAVPSDQAGLQMRLDIRYRWTGQLLRLLLRSPRVRIAVTYVNGERADYRLVPALARDGLWIGNLPRDRDGVEHLLSGNAPQAVRSFRLVSTPPGWLDPRIPVEFVRLPVRFTD